MQTAVSRESVWAYLESLALSDDSRQWLADRLLQSIKPASPAAQTATSPRQPEGETTYVNPSPSGDPWFDDPQNMAIVLEGVAQHKKGMGRVYTMEEIREMLGL